ncbi:Spx/MgsR family RNA polymerase-binding regulatory protein [Vreelandella subglaciescola]|jgi:Spx/MgsR family transcriptional regulator|uniref:Transcriptional regulator, Spx/MgsR family n=1 Tax=Vreelandella subglaciescola TaxID=29571 RepID=A0A1M7G6W9_9GAMM|nr:Spx/MgsR family RNA polymerase-binding regulatory protein [Halomonas subglaciescola]SHM12030.1 transcriptional regulator, Spx/MgsR family [Halomonas subglaciescola]
MLTIYTINTCDTCRKARRALDAQGVDYRVHDLRRDGLSDELLAYIFERVALTDAVNKRSKTWRELSATDQQAFEQPTVDDSARKLLQAYPTLLKRPLLAVDDATLRVGYKDGDYDDL